MNLIPFGIIYGKRRPCVSPEAQSTASISDRAVVAVAVIALLCGVFFRFADLGHKLYTNDEATTSVHVSGHTIGDYLAAAGAGRITTTAEALRYQHVDPATGIGDVVHSLAIEDPQHPPVFYVLERAWEALAGTSVGARRSLPALFGVLALLAAYWFGQTLVGRAPSDARARPSPAQAGVRRHTIVDEPVQAGRADGRRFGLVLAALVAVSPFHIVYAQQAREYSLWTVFVFASSAALLRALAGSAPSGRPDWRRWAVFGALSAGGLYTDVIYLYTLPAQALYVFVAYRRDVAHKVLPFVAAAAAAIAAFSPWLLTLVQHSGAVTNNMYLGAPLPAQAIALKWLFNVGVVFFDLDYLWHPSGLIVVPILALAACGVAQLLGRRPRAAGYVLALGFVTAAAFVIPDLAQHESRSTAARYLIPSWIALETAVAFALWTWLGSIQRRVRSRAVVAFGALLACGVASASVSATRDAWWADASVAPIGPIARIVRMASPPVTVIFREDQPIWNFAPMELANEVPPQTRLQLLTGDALPAVTAGKTAFLLDPSARLRRAVAGQGWQLTEVYAQPASTGLRALRHATSLARARAGLPNVRSSLWLLRSRAWHCARCGRVISVVPALDLVAPASPARRPRRTSGRSRQAPGKR